MLKKLIHAIKQFSMNEREKLEAVISLKELKTFIKPCSFPPPTVDAGTRSRLEQLRLYSTYHRYLGISDKNLQLAREAIRNVVSKRMHTRHFSMVKLDGFTNSKSHISSNNVRASQPTMVEFGRRVNDLEDLEGKKGKEVINACKSWYELRLNQGIELITDSWHKRYYWSNLGGSHHMAKLCYELYIQGEDWCPEVEIKEYFIELNSLEPLKNKVSIFVVMREREGIFRNKIFTPLPQHLVNHSVLSGLGEAVPSQEHYQFPLNTYQLVLVDHSKEYSDITIKLLNEAIKTGFAMSFNDFLRSWTRSQNKEKMGAKSAQ